MKPYVTAIILAGGAGARFEVDVPKQFVKIAGKRVIEYTIEPFQQHPAVKEIVVVVHQNYRDLVLELVKRNHFSKVTGIVIGGETRQESSYIGLQACSPETTHVLIHDAARPFVTEKIISTMIDQFKEYDAIDTVINTADTIVKIDLQTNLIVDIPERKSLKRGQTPQGFRLEVIKKAHELALSDGVQGAPDDCSLVLRKNLAKILVIAGDEANIKITYPLDIYIADRIFQLRKGSIDIKSRSEIARAVTDKVAVIFGGRQGIGQAIGKLLTECGATVHAYGRDVDVRDYQAVTTTLENVHTASGRIDFVVNCAGQLRLSLIEHETVEHIQEILETNLLGSMLVAKASIPYLRESRGHLVLFTSSSYTRGREGYTPYSASKAGVVNFAQGFSEEVQEDGIKVNVINPERTRTPMRLKNFGKEDESLLLRPETVAIKTISLFLSEVTGQVIDVRKEEETAILQRYGWPNL